MPFILGKKIEMSQVFKDDKVIPVTLVEAGPCYVVQVKTEEKDGYSAIQLGFEKKKKNVKKTEKSKEYKHLKEFRVEPSELKSFKKGQEIKASVLKEGDKARVSAISKGKGFQGAVKRWGFHGRNATHGAKHEERTVGSIGATGPARVMPGKKMPGRMGGERISVKNLEVVRVDEKNNLVALKGAVPGRRGSLVEIRS